jgi:hypothetical protein
MLGEEKNIIYFLHLFISVFLSSFLSYSLPFSVIPPFFISAEISSCFTTPRQLVASKKRRGLSSGTGKDWIRPVCGSSRQQFQQNFKIVIAKTKMMFFKTIVGLLHIVPRSRTARGLRVCTYGTLVSEFGV